LNISSSNIPAQTLELNCERKLSHQNSHSRLVARYALDASSSAGPTSPHNPENINASLPAMQNGNSYKPPMTPPGVKQWLNKNSKNSKKTPSPGPPSGTTSPFTMGHATYRYRRQKNPRSLISLEGKRTSLSLNGRIWRELRHRCEKRKWGERTGESIESCRPRKSPRPNTEASCLWILLTRPSS
jgi:hypothetical protein